MMRNGGGLIVKPNLPIPRDLVGFKGIKYAIDLIIQLKKKHGHLIIS